MAPEYISCPPLTLVAESQQKHFRLLELPAELLALLTSADPPKLELKASESTESDEGGHVVLCTQNKTFELRQKNSSNTVYLLQPHEIAEAGHLILALQAVAQCYSTLELTAAKPTEYDAWKLMRMIVPCNDGQNDSRAPKSRRALFDQMPFHESLCNRVSLELAIFEHPETDSVFRPDQNSMFAEWQRITTTADLLSIRLVEPFRLDDLTASDDLSYNAGTRGILQSFSITDKESGLTTIDPDRCVFWVGRMFLEYRTAEQPVTQKVLLDGWKDLLPEKWRELADIAKLSLYLQTSEDGKSISFKDRSPDKAAWDDVAARGKKRKWHDKFRPQK